jgi:4,5-dihydroxyphthalate decarboxylase
MPNTNLRLTLATSDYDHVRDLSMGPVEPEGIDLTCLTLQIEEMFHRFINFSEFDISEISSGKYTSMISQGDDRFVGLPVFPSRVFRQSSLYVRPDGPVKRPEDLAGRKIGLPEWGQSAAVYSRGWIQHDVGIPLGDIEWLQGGVNMAGRKEKVALKLPAGIKLTPRPDKSLTQLLLDGEIDAILTAHPPELVEHGDPRIVRLYEDYQPVEEEYYRRTGIWPIMHLYAIRRPVFEANPWVAMSMVKALTEAKDRAMTRILDLTACRAPFAWCYDAAAKAKALFGDDFYPYGIEKNRKTLEAFLQYGYEQGLFHRHLTPEEMFPKEVQSTFKV